MEDALQTMRNASFITLPLLFAGSPAAFAAEVADLSPKDVGKVSAAIDSAAQAASRADEFVTMSQVVGDSGASQNFFTQLGIPDYGQLF